MRLYCTVRLYMIFIIPDQELFSIGPFLVIHRIWQADLAEFKIFEDLAERGMIVEA